MFDFRGILNLDVQTGSGSDLTLNPVSGFDHILNPVHPYFDNRIRNAIGWGKYRMRH